MINITETDLDKFIKSLESNEKLTTESIKGIEKLKSKPTDINTFITTPTNLDKNIVNDKDRNLSRLEILEPTPKPNGSGK